MAIDAVVDQEGLKDVKVEEMCTMEYDRQSCASSSKTMGTLKGNGESKAKKLVLRKSLKKTTIEERKTKEAIEPKLNSKLANKHDDKMDWHTNTEVKDSDADSKSDSISDSDSKSDSKSDDDSKSDESKSDDDSKSEDSKSEDSKSDSSSKVGPKSGGKKNKKKKKRSQLKEEENSFKQDTSLREDEHMEVTDKNKDASKEEKLPAFGKDAMEEGTRDIN
ncbi:hypothetical protein HPP92_002476 [Vanilla planifolia]|uniref:Uncharacterized protein n=1 Tax=Vanilla planifolia TaxID=51239 RepID=A0A835VI25_VANPL|nr:hypothetical protein HPP92_002476 [Vanilla planifolia]